MLDNNTMAWIQDRQDKEEMTTEKYIHALLERAASDRASDVHIEPLTGKIRIRFRIDGKLQEKEIRPFDELEIILNHLKIVANLDITAHAKPQEGHFELDISPGNKEQKQTRVLDVRISIFPTVNGEATVMRLLNRSEMLISLQDLGMQQNTFLTVKGLISKSYGMVLITGPSGSGKTTTLYSLLHELRSKEKNIITLEDPVEYHFEDIRQSRIRPDLGFTFASGMRSILRQDPDVVMIGEIRDPDTAEHAVRASLTGRIVFATVHSNSTIGTVARLVDMNIERSLIAYALNGVLSQRLVRKICSHCKESYVPKEAYLKYFKLDVSSCEFVRGKGCKECNGTGYFGRVGIFEVLEFDDNIRSLIVERASMNDLQEYIEKSGMKFLMHDAVEKVLSGVTTIEEAVSIA